MRTERLEQEKARDRTETARIVQKQDMKRDAMFNKEVHQEKKEHSWLGTKGAERVVADHEHANIAEVREAYVTG